MKPSDYKVGYFINNKYIYINSKYKNTNKLKIVFLKFQVI